MKKFHIAIATNNIEGTIEDYSVRLGMVLFGNVLVLDNKQMKLMNYGPKLTLALRKIASLRHKQ